MFIPSNEEVSVESNNVDEVETLFNEIQELGADPIETSEEKPAEEVNPQEEVTTEDSSPEQVAEGTDSVVVTDAETKASEVAPANNNPQSQPTPEQIRNEAFAQMRVENKRHKDLIAKAAAAHGLSVEDYEAKIQQDLLLKEAAEAKLPPEVYQRLKDMEEKTAAYEAEKAKLAFQGRVTAFQASNNLSNDDLDSFFNACFNAGITPHETAVDFNILYRGLNFDKLVETQRQDWIAKQNRNRAGSSTPNSGTGQTENLNTTINSVEDLDAIMRKM